MMLALLPFLVPVWASSDTCTDKILNETGIGGGGTVTALANVTGGMAACCALCHGNYHDECSGWVYGQTPEVAATDMRLPKHNCAIMATNGHAHSVAGHISGINRNAPPTPAPAPPGKACNADIDCGPLTSKQWRCEAAKAAPSAENNCHLPGPGRQGNSTCACSVQRCTVTPMPTNHSAKSQYLVIGDSISLGMNSLLTELVKTDGWELTHNPGNAASSNLGMHCVTDWVGADTRKYDVISFQFGLHDLGFDTERISVEQYSGLMNNITTYLTGVQRLHGTKLLWVRTTPVPTVPTYGPACNDTKRCLNPPRFDRDVVAYNKAADAVISAANDGGAKIAIADLYSFVLAKCGGKGYSSCPGFQLPMNVHFTADGWAALAGEMHRILKTL